MRTNASLASTTDFIRDGTHGSPERVENGIPVLSAQNVIGGVLNFDTDRFTSLAEYEAFDRRVKIRPGDVLVTIVGTIGRCAVVTETRPLVFQRSVAILRPNKHVLDSRFLFHSLQSKHVARQLTKSINQSSQAGVYLGKLGKITFPLPSIAEQRHIAEILDTADDLRHKRQEMLGRLDNLQEAIFADMFVRIERNDWPLRRVADIATNVRTGPFGSQLLHSEFVDKGIAVLGIDNAVNNEFRWDQRRFITPEKYQGLRRYTVRAGDVLITIMGTCGRCAIVPEDIPAAINTKHLCCITLDLTRALPEFLHAAFLQHPSVLKQLGVQAKGAVMPGLNMGIIKSLELRIPPLELQRAFVSRVEALCDMRTSCREHGDQLDNLFASLQHRAFRGELTSGDVTRELEIAG